MSSSPRIKELTERIFPIIGRFLREKKTTTPFELSRFLETQNIKRMVFRPYSYQLEYVLINLVCSARINEDGGVLSLSQYRAQCFEESK